MKTLTKYQCEICDREYLNSEDALKCEAEGKEEPLCQIGTTVSFKDDWNGGFGTCYHDLVVYEIKDYGHFISYKLGTEYDKDEDGTILYAPCETVDGNKGFLDLCKIVNLETVENTTL
jgi:hypothetical protein